MNLIFFTAKIPNCFNSFIHERKKKNVVYKNKINKNEPLFVLEYNAECVPTLHVVSVSSTTIIRIFKKRRKPPAKTENAAFAKFLALIKIHPNNSDQEPQAYGMRQAF